MTTATQEKTTCTLTIVDMGRSDRVLNVYPANGPKEKIWLDTVKGIERWEAVKRFLYNHAVRGTKVPDPAPWCDDPQDLKAITLRESNIPRVTLEDGYVFEVAVEPKKATDEIVVPAQASDLESRVERMETGLGAMAEAIERLTKAMDRKGKPGRPPKETE